MWSRVRKKMLKEKMKNAFEELLFSKKKLKNSCNEVRRNKELHQDATT